MTNAAPQADAAIHIRLSTLGQLFNSMDPSPFHERELDAAAEDFIVSSLDELPPSAEPTLLIELPAAQFADSDGASVERAIRNHFNYRLDDGRRKMRRHFREGRIALLIGSVFLFVCMGIRELVFVPMAGPVSSVFAEGLLILGWVAMWWPLQIFLYDWWPLRHQARLHARLATMRVSLRASAPA